MILRQESEGKTKKRSKGPEVQREQPMAILIWLLDIVNISLWKRKYLSMSVKIICVQPTGYHEIAIWLFPLDLWTFGPLDLLLFFPFTHSHLTLAHEKTDVDSSSDFIFFSFLFTIKISG
jgi:hypothetical protein